jgi:hypothetical protein
VLAVKLSYKTQWNGSYNRARQRERENQLTDADKSASSGFDTVPDAKPQSFAPAEMITCDTCLRANPPTRSNCLYCGAILPGTRNAPEAQPTREPRPDVNVTSGFYVVLAPNQSSVRDDSSLAEIAELLHLGTNEAQSTVGLGRPAPLLRAATFDQATLLAERLVALGIGVDIFREDALNLDTPPRKIRALEFSDDGLAGTLMSGGGVSVPWDDLILVVIGRLLVNRKESEERRRRGRSQPLDTRELFSDEPVADLYTRSDEVGRISSSSFDFSCLGTEKAMTAFENFTTLIKLLSLRAPNVEVDDSYRNLRAVLTNIWPLEPQTRKGEWRRSGAGKVDISTVTTIDNEIQFNSYSRLRQQVKVRELEGDR